MFRGVSFLNLDAKGRLAIPARYRELLQSVCESRLVVTVGSGGCLLVYPLPTWMDIEQAIDRLPSFDTQVQALQRVMIGHAQEIDLDSQGRVLLPPALRQIAKLGKRVAFVGQGKKFELWDEESWNQKCAGWFAEIDQARAEPTSSIASLNI